MSRKLRPLWAHSLALSMEPRACPHDWVPTLHGWFEAPTEPECDWPPQDTAARTITEAVKAVLKGNNEGADQ